MRIGIIRLTNSRERLVCITDSITFIGILYIFLEFTTKIHIIFYFPTPMTIKLSEI